MQCFKFSIEPHSVIRENILEIGWSFFGVRVWSTIPYPNESDIISYYEWSQELPLGAVSSRWKVGVRHVTLHKVKVIRVSAVNDAYGMELRKELFVFGTSSCSPVISRSYFGGFLWNLLNSLGTCSSKPGRFVSFLLSLGKWTLGYNRYNFRNNIMYVQQTNIRPSSM